MRLLVLFVGLLFSVSTMAEETALAGFLRDAGQPRSRADRLKLARLTLAEVELLADQLQTPKPSEIEWIESEQAAAGRLKGDASNQRYFRLVKSPEFNASKVYNTTRELKNALNCAADPSNEIRREIFCWAVASYHLADREAYVDGIGILLAADRVPATLSQMAGKSTRDLTSVGYPWYSRMIQEQLVIPYLRGSLQ